MTRTLSEWLEWIASIHPSEMELSLERTKMVAEKLNLLKPSFPIITVGGTNGKGSCVAGLEAIYLAAGYRVGAFTSPILWKHNESVRIQGRDVEDFIFCDAFSRVEEARGDITLTIFEFNTLAALLIFSHSIIDVGILEVGLGGRWDAVNVMDADVAVIASISLDHTELLGSTRDEIGYEKAGIFRFGKPIVCGDEDPPQSLVTVANELKSPFFCQHNTFGFENSTTGWTWWNKTRQLKTLPCTALALQNMSSVLMVIDLLQPRLPVTEKSICHALSTVKLTGRLQWIPGKINQLFDVSHNPASAALLSEYLKKTVFRGKKRAVFSMLKEKDIAETLLQMKKEIDEWYIAPLQTKRASSLDLLLAALDKANITSRQLFSSLSEAYSSAISDSQTDDWVIVFGSFHTVAATLDARAHASTL